MAIRLCDDCDTIWQVTLRSSKMRPTKSYCVDSFNRLRRRWMNTSEQSRLAVVGSRRSLLPLAAAASCLQRRPALTAGVRQHSATPRRDLLDQPRPSTSDTEWFQTRGQRQKTVKPRYASNPPASPPC